MEELDRQYITEIEKLEKEERALKKQYRQKIEEVKKEYEGQRDQEIERKVKQKTNEINEKYKKLSEEQEQKDNEAKAKIEKLKQDKIQLEQNLQEIKTEAEAELKKRRSELQKNVEEKTEDYKMSWQLVYLRESLRNTLKPLQKLTEEDLKQYDNEQNANEIEAMQEQIKTAREYLSYYESKEGFNNRNDVIKFLEQYVKPIDMNWSKEQEEYNKLSKKDPQRMDEICDKPILNLIESHKEIFKMRMKEEMQKMEHDLHRKILDKKKEIFTNEREMLKLSPSRWNQSDIQEKQYKEIQSETNKIHLNSNGDGKDEEFNQLKTQYDKSVKDLKKEQDKQLYKIELEKQGKYNKYQSELAEQRRMEIQKMEEENKKTIEDNKKQLALENQKFEQELERQKQERIKRQKEHEERMRETEQRRKKTQELINETNTESRESQAKRDKEQQELPKRIAEMQRESAFNTQLQQNYTFNTSINNQSTLPTTMNNYNQQQSYIPQQKKYYTTNKSNTSPNISNTSPNMNHRKFIFKVPKSMNSSQQLYNSDSTEASNGIYYSNKTNNQAMYNQQTENQNYNSHQPQMQLRNATQYSNIKNYNTMAQVQKIDNLNYQYGNQNINNNSNMNPNIDVFLSQSNSFNRVYNDHRQQIHKQQNVSQNNFFRTQNSANSSFSFDGRNC